MVTKTSRSQKDMRQFANAKEAMFLIRGLNGDLHPDTQKHRKKADTRALLALVKRLQALANYMEDATKPKSVAAFAKEHRGLSRLLRRYVCTPMILPIFFGPKLEGKERNWDLAWMPVPYSRRRETEITLALNAIKLTEARRINTIKQCARCKRWLFARFAHQRFCSDECKQIFHRSDPGEKQRRRDWARNNYWTHKTKNIK